METRYRMILQRNRPALVKNLEPSVLYDGLLAKGVFTQDMIDSIKVADSGTRADQARQLVIDLEKRGNRAFPIFLVCLRETGQHSLADLLQNGEPIVQIEPLPPVQSSHPVHVPPQQSSHTVHVPLQQPLHPLRDLQPEPLPPAHVLRPAIQPLPISPMDIDRNPPINLVPRPTPIQRPSPTEGDTGRGRRTRRDSLQAYKMEASPVGQCLIINNMEFDPKSGLSRRNGSNIDCDKMERRFKALSFDVKVKTNLKYKQIRHELEALSKKDHSCYDCCVVIILSHGTEVSHNRFPGAVHGVDGPAVPVQLITNYLSGQHCPSLQGKPKLFFIQACGGGERDVGFEVSPEEVRPSLGGIDDQTDAIPLSSSSDSLSMSDETDARATLPTPSDILVSYSTFPGYVSWRDTQSGSWYIETLDRVLEENADTDDLVSMLTIVNNEVSQNSAKGLYKQMPGSFNFLRKNFYFLTRPQR